MVDRLSQGDIDAIAQMPMADRLAVMQRAYDHFRFNKAEFFEPYQKQWDFIKLGMTCAERLLSAGNQLGKSEVGAYELSRHLTGLYPKDWPGRRYVGPNDWWAAGVSATTVRDIQQAKLCGKPGSTDDFGTGFIEKHCFADKPSTLRNVPNAYDTVPIYHHDENQVVDGISYLQFKAYEQGRDKFQGKTLTGGVWWDEEPDVETYDEGNARWTATGGMSLMTFTPLKGYTDVVSRFLENEDKSRDVIKFRAEECPHLRTLYGDDFISVLKAKYPQHEWEARLNGEPKLGEGAIFRTPEEFLKYPASKNIPEWWPKIWGIDFGISHPFAAVLAAWDRDEDVIYLLTGFKLADALPAVHAERIRDICADAPVAWPHDGAAREKGSGETLAKQYKRYDLKMLPTHSHFSDGSMSTEAAVLEMQNRFANGKLKINENFEELLNELRGYHRKDGKIVKVRDDLISAAMKIIMMKRKAQLADLGYQPHRQRIRNKRPTGGVLNPWTGRREPAHAF